ncbi:Clp1/GlmU family protein [Salinarimonas sp.]|uniref:Clp1/GlmU family protein n=1 Tax=Salinarimonas sp. TaxID=2766526 RepID=UPI0032D9541B
MRENGFQAPPDQAEAIGRIVGSGGRVLVLGPVDVGKSAFCRLLLEAGAQAGRRVALVDADPGQKTVGPPAAVTLARGPDLRLAGLAFVGAVDVLRAPARVARGVEAALARLAGEGGADLAAINSAGLVTRPGHGLIRALIAAARPDAIVAIGGGEALAPALAGARAPILALDPSPRARRKSAGARARARREAFAAYFAEAEIRRLRLDAAARAALADAPDGLLLGLCPIEPCGDALALLAGRDGEEALLLAPQEVPRAPSTDAPLPARIVPGFVTLDPDWRAAPLPAPEP